jgi:predicted RNase H-like HicB family nuclease
MDSRKKKIYTVLIEQGEDGIYAKVPYIVGCHTQDKSVSWIMEWIKETHMS